MVPAGSFPFQCAFAREALAFPPAPLGVTLRSIWLVSLRARRPQDSRQDTGATSHAARASGMPEAEAVGNSISIIDADWRRRMQKAEPRRGQSAACECLFHRLRDSRFSQRRHDLEARFIRMQAVVGQILLQQALVVNHRVEVVEIRAVALGSAVILQPL